VLRDCRVLEEQLSAKMEPVDELGNDGDSDGHFDVEGFSEGATESEGVVQEDEW
jgi:hypothetical protein